MVGETVDWLDCATVVQWAVLSAGEMVVPRDETKAEHLVERKVYLLVETTAGWTVD